MHQDIYKKFEDFTNIVRRISNGFSDLKVYYALYFDKIMTANNKKAIEQFFDTIFQYSQESGNDISWTEFKFYCVKEIMKKEDGIQGFDINEYHIKLLVEVIEMKSLYNGYMFLPEFEEKLKKAQYDKNDIESICDDIKYLFDRCLISDNLNMFFFILKCVSECMSNTESRNKDLQISLLDVFIWLIERTKRLNNKQFNEIVFIELNDMVKKLDSKRNISKDFGDMIVSKIANLAKHSDSDSYNVIFEVIEILTNFLKENEELYFIYHYVDRKKLLYRNMFNIATSCIENDFEEGVRRCSNAIGWFTIYSIRQGNHDLTKYLLRLAKGMLEISMDMNISTKTQAFLLTLFTTVGMYCCKDSTNLKYINEILNSIQKVNSKLVYTAIKIRTYENDMWDSLFEDKTQQLATTFRKKYEENQKKLTQRN